MNYSAQEVKFLSFRVCCQKKKKRKEGKFALEYFTPFCELIIFEARNFSPNLKLFIFSALITRRYFPVFHSETIPEPLSHNRNFLRIKKAIKKKEVFSLPKSSSSAGQWEARMKNA